MYSWFIHLVENLIVLEFVLCLCLGETCLSLSLCHNFIVRLASQSAHLHEIQTVIRLYIRWKRHFGDNISSFLSSISLSLFPQSILSYHISCLAHSEQFCSSVIHSLQLSKASSSTLMNFSNVPPSTFVGG